MAGMLVLKGKFFTAADVNGNGKIELVDVLSVQKYLAGVTAEVE